MNKKDLYLKLFQENKRLVETLKRNNVTNFRLISLGNSIGSGYSLRRTTKPLLIRNESLKPIFKKGEINLELFHFARAQNNNDECIFEWLATNIKESEIQKLNQLDYGKGPIGKPVHGLSKEQMEMYYSSKEPRGLQELIFDIDPNMANIVIYNGCTGSFLDNVTRQGSIFHKLTHGIKRDTRSLEATLKWIQINNRNKGANTQVYLCGVPDFLGLKISEFINQKLRKIAKQYANVVYVEPVKSKFFYKSLEEKNSFLLKADLHYDEKEYEKFNLHIIEKINANYSKTNAMIKFDRLFYMLNRDFEKHASAITCEKSYIQSLLEKFTEQLCIQVDSTKKKELYIQLKQYLMNRFPYDFYYLGKKELKKSLKKIYH